MEARFVLQRYLYLFRNESGIKTLKIEPQFLLHKTLIEYSEIIGYCQLMNSKFFMFDSLLITENQTKNLARTSK